MKTPKLHLSIILLILLAACSGNKEHKIDVTIPENLADYKDVKQFLDQRISITEDYNLVLIEAIELAGEDGKVEEDEDLTAMQVIKLGKIAYRLNKLTSTLEELQSQEASVRGSLPENLVVEFDATCQLIDSHLKDNLEGGHTLFAEGNNENEPIEKTQAQVEWEQAQQELPPEQRLENQTTDQEGESSTGLGFIGVIFPLLVLGGVIFSIVLGIKKLRGRVRDMSYAMSEAKSASQEILKDPKAFTGKDRELSEEEARTLEEFADILNDNKTSKN